MTFSEYYVYYLSLHQNLWCRRLHVLGQFVTILYVLAVIYVKFWLLLVVAPLVVYPFAWSGHYFFEKNEPAALSSPLMAKAADWVMLKDWLIGRIER